MGVQLYEKKKSTTNPFQETDEEFVQWNDLPKPHELSEMSPTGALALRVLPFMCSDVVVCFGVHCASSAERRSLGAGSSLRFTQDRFLHRRCYAQFLLSKFPQVFLFVSFLSIGSQLLITPT